MNKLTDVFGTSRSVPLTYTERNNVDDRFVNDLTRDKHIILHGGSKQGKTSLRKNVLRDDECIIIQCTRDTTRATLYEMLLKKANVEYEVSSRETVKGTNKLTVKISGEGKIPFVAKAGVEGGGEFEKGKESTTDFKKFDIDIEDPNDVVRVLEEQNFNTIVVIEDFHYLDEEVQSLFAFDLKVFHETSKIIFLIVGVWLESNRLIIFNGDLTGRVTSVTVDNWPDKSLRIVIERGLTLLNIRYPEEVIAEIISISQDNVGLLQEICYRLCEKHGIWQTQQAEKTVGSIAEISELAKEISDDQAARYRNFMVKFSEGFGPTELEMYKWIIYGVLKSSPQELRSGINASKLFLIIKPKHPKSSTLQLNNLLSALERVQNLQFKHKLQPLIFDYSDSRLSVVDANFLIYLKIQDIPNLLENFGLS